MRKKTPNLQHQNLREKKKRQIYNIKIYVRKKTPNLQHQYLREKQKTPNLKHQNLRGKNKREKFTTSLTTSRTTLDVCQNTDRGRCLNQIINQVISIPNQSFHRSFTIRPAMSYQRILQKLATDDFITESDDEMVAMWERNHMVYHDGATDKAYLDAIQEIHQMPWRTPGEPT